MRVTRLAVRNHRRLADFEIRVAKHLVLVGPNDVGKTSALRCLDLLLGASTAQIYQRIDPSDFRSAVDPLVIEADLSEFDADDEAAFPDEITIDPLSGTQLLLLRLTAILDDEQSIDISRTCPGSGTGRQLTRSQLAHISWRSLGANSQARDLRDDRRNIFHEILEAVEFGDEKAGFQALSSEFEKLLGESATLKALRERLATELSKALPRPIKTEHLALTPGASADGDILGDVRLQVKQDDTTHNLSAQSDGTKALFAITFYDIATSTANIVAIDEPEIHLHPTSQRSLASLLAGSANQKMIATHSPEIVGAFDPECIVAVREDGSLVQPQPGFLSNEDRMIIEWWVPNKLEPLTARRVVAVEGISDRIILQRVAALTGRNLDQFGTSVIQTDGSGNMASIIKLFGASGFNIPFLILIDEDARTETAKRLGVQENELEQHSVWVSAPDLEGEYVTALGASEAWAILQASHLFSRNELSNCSSTGAGGTKTVTDVAEFCRSRKYKVKAAMAVAPQLTKSTSTAIQSIESLLKKIGPSE